MTWRVNEKLEARDYRLPVEKEAFRAGYSDGYHGLNRRQSDWPNSYSAGYWEGRHDKRPET